MPTTPRSARTLTRAALVTASFFLLGFGSCETGDADAPFDPPAAWDGGMHDIDLPEGSNLCLAVRGNGPRLTAHASSIARIVEHYGFFEAVAGGSSGAITSFFVQAVQDNPHVGSCGGHPCREVERRARASLLFKSVHGYVEVLGETDEASAAQTLAEIVGRLQRAGVAGLLQSNPLEGLAALRRVLTDPDVRGLVDSETLAALTRTSDPLGLARDLVEVSSKGVNFQVEDERFFLTPGILDMDFVARRLGRVAQFYAGEEPVHEGAMADFLDLCAEFAWGLPWTDIRRLPSGVGDSTCGQVFDDLLGDYLDALGTVDGPVANRIDRSVASATTPAFAVTSVLTGATAASWRAAQADYLAGRAWDWEPDFADVRFGYWGATELLSGLEERVPRREDERSRRFVGLGEVPWRTAIAASITEPGLGAGVPLDDGSVSVGGWGDPTPTLVLEEHGCENILLLTRKGGAGWFPTGVSELLGADEAAGTALYSLDAPHSSYARSIEAADAVWCSDWDTPPVTDLPAMFAVGYDAPMESSDPFFTDSPLPYAGLRASLDEPGCSPSRAEEVEPLEPAPVACGRIVAGDTSLDAAATHRFDGYACNVGNYAAPERAFAFHAERGGEVEWRLVDPRPSELDHDVLVLALDEQGRPGECLTWGPNSARFEAEAGRSYLLLVDGFDDAAGPFEAELRCDR